MSTFKARLKQIEQQLYRENQDAVNALVSRLSADEKTMLLNALGVNDWRTEAIEYIRKGEISFQFLADEFDPDLARDLFREAGLEPG